MRRKFTRVAAVTVDQLVTCPNCGEPMHAVEGHLFHCSACGADVTPEEAIGPAPAR